MKGIAAAAAAAFLLCGLGSSQPGLTIDEGLNVRPGVVLVRAEWQSGLATLSPSLQSEIFTELQPHDYPPLGRVVLGLAHEAVVAVRGSHATGSPGGIDVTAARWGSAACFGLTIALVGWFTLRWAGSLAGLAAAVAMLTTPRLLAHAQIASIETVLNLVYAACVLITADRLAVTPTPKRAAACGVLWGLVLLTKIQAVLIPIPLAAWLLWRFRKAAVAPLAIYGAVGLAVFVVGWPWLWGDPIGRVPAYFGGDGRATLHAFYLGQTWADRDVPWHYPLVWFATTQPVVWLLLGAWGSARTLRERDGQPRDGRLLFALMAAAFPLLFFAMPGITVYDGARLFLVSLPLWAVLVGVGAEAAWSRLPSLRIPLAAASVLLPAVQMATLWPCGLSHFSITTKAAAAIGLETTYWGDSLTPAFWAESLQGRGGAVVGVAPTLHPFQLTEQSYHLPSYGLPPDVMLVPWPGNETAAATDLMVFARRADLKPESTERRLLGVPIGETVDGWTVRHRLVRQGVVLAVHAVRAE